MILRLSNFFIMSQVQTPNICNLNLWYTNRKTMDYVKNMEHELPILIYFFISLFYRIQVLTDIRYLTIIKIFKTLTT